MNGELDQLPWCAHLRFASQEFGIAKALMGEVAAAGVLIWTFVRARNVLFFWRKNATDYHRTSSFDSSTSGAGDGTASKGGGYTDDLAEDSAKLVILPPYRYTFWFLVAVHAMGSVCGLGRAWSLWSPGVDAVLPIRVLIRFALEGVALFLVQKGAGQRAVKWALQHAAVWCAFLYMIEWLAWWDLSPFHDNTWASTQAQLWTLSEEVAVMIFYGVLWLWPSQRMYRRPAVRPYARGLAIYQLVMVICAGFSFLAADFLHCGYSLLVVTRYAFTSGLVLYALLLDSNFWRGIMSDAELQCGHTHTKQKKRSKKQKLAATNATDSNGDGSADGSNGENKAMMREPLMGISLAPNTIGALTRGLDRLDDSHVEMLNYAYLTLGAAEGGPARLLAAGGTARVYKGSYKGDIVAVKLVYCIDLTPSVIRAFVAEARKLHALKQSKRVVDLIGVCVRPPSIAIVLELCEYGSLSTVLASPQHETIAMDSETNRPAVISLTPRNRLLICYQCSMAIAALHGLNPPMLHLDIKPSNFLVSAVSPGEALPLYPIVPESRPIASSTWTSHGGNASTDSARGSVFTASKATPIPAPAPSTARPRLGSGIATSPYGALSTAMAAASALASPATPTPPDSESASGNNSPRSSATNSHGNGQHVSPGMGVAAAIQLTEANDSSSWSFSCKIADLELSVALTEVRAPYVRIPDTFQWTAPELLGATTPEAKREHISLATDCYALGMVLYEVWTGRSPFAEHSQDTPHLRRGIADGSIRPRWDEVDPHIDPIGYEIGEMVKQLWHADPQQRPTAKSVSSRLRRLLARPSLLPATTAASSAAAPSSPSSAIAAAVPISPRATFAIAPPTDSSLMVAHD